MICECEKFQANVLTGIDIRYKKKLHCDVGGLFANLYLRNLKTTDL